MEIIHGYFRTRIEDRERKYDPESGNEPSGKKFFNSLFLINPMARNLFVFQVLA
jgi:hypothetical protein